MTTPKSDVDLANALTRRHYRIGPFQPDIVRTVRDAGWMPIAELIDWMELYAERSGFGHHTVAQHAREHFGVIPTSYASTSMDSETR